ncbi:hypothetical protein T440DRAFT_556657 [Plenodomus tracheiphilus IPT5]|uniref:Uncharacterized protein n=1 Tax=Plenodomus tracheiphilus IPT5 TaxID=1408161 RepID=A0A6A7AZ75_9PLEO|nr:hypothetical protein T440DRAFT_556657 [Plenodomus tracheiphilus IPT5]
MSPSPDASQITLFAHLLRHLVKLISDMWDYSSRFGFSARAPTSDEDASTPLRAAEEGAVMQDNRDTPTGPAVVQSVGFMQSRSGRPSRPDLSCPIKPNSSPLKHSAYTPHSPTRTGNLYPDFIFARMKSLLERLKGTTPASLPPYNPRIQTKSHAQVLKGRVLPVGNFIITHVLVREPEESRGSLELDLCRHIATHYWPSPVTNFTHLYILEMYRNVQFKVAIS